MTALAVGSNSRRMVWTGRGLSAFVTLFLLFDTTIHLLVPAPVVQAFAELGIPLRLSVAIGLIELACIILYLVPRTAVMGAILLTGYLGGALAIQLRIDAPAFNLVFPFIIGALIWGGLGLRDERVKKVLL